MTSSGNHSPRPQSRNSMHSSNTHTSNTSSKLDSRDHKHYHSHVHIETPYPMVEHAATWDVTTSNPSTTSFFDIRKQHHHNFLPKHLPSLPNPVHTVEDHIAEFRFGHSARSAKRDAKRLAEHNAHDGSQHGSLKRHSPVQTIPEYAETTEDWSERDARAWAEELKKREAARRMSWDSCGGWSGRSMPTGEERSHLRTE